MDARSLLTEQFEEDRPRLHDVAYRMLGSRTEAEDAVQEAWLRLARTDAASVENPSGWLTTVVSRVCLDMLRSRASRREQSIGEQVIERSPARGEGADPEGEAVLADSVGVALLVVLDALSPAERVAFVLHDLFGLPFEEIARILGRSTAAAKQLASRARRRVRGSPGASDGDRARQREVVVAFMRAVRAGDLEGLLAVLDPDAVIHIDAAARSDGVIRDANATRDVGKPRELRRAATWAPQLIALSRALRPVEPALLDGSVGLILAPSGKVLRALRFTFANDRVTRLDVIGDPARLRELEIAVLARRDGTSPRCRGCRRGRPRRAGAGGRGGRARPLFALVGKQTEMRPRRWARRQAPRCRGGPARPLLALLGKQTEMRPRRWTRRHAPRCRGGRARPLLALAGKQTEMRPRRWTRRQAACDSTSSAIQRASARSRSPCSADETVRSGVQDWKRPGSGSTAALARCFRSTRPCLATSSSTTS
ncbi:MAG TPA: sigma-70 family RNA polymerase sigma factor [Polyangiaceae bacterium]|nr:sigma-70 family RNA polymerase sigma factor [Polyangiaceae bacterium]